MDLLIFSSFLVWTPSSYLILDLNLLKNKIVVIQGHADCQASGKCCPFKIVEGKCLHCKIRIFLNFIYGIFFHPFKNIVPKGRKNYLLTTEIAIWKLEIFHKRWNLTHFQNYEILFTNLWKIIPYFRNLFHTIPK